MKRFIISVLGKDRPGIIAAVTKVLFDLELNIEDVSQTILQNQQIMIIGVTRSRANGNQHQMPTLHQTEQKQQI